MDCDAGERWPDTGEEMSVLVRSLNLEGIKHPIQCIRVRRECKWLVAQ